MQGGQVFVLNTADATLIQISKEANPGQFRSVGGVTPNKSGSLVAYIVSDSSKQRALIVPNYLPEYATTSTFRRGWTEQKVYVMPTDGSRYEPFEVTLPKPEGVSSFRRMAWAAGGRSLIIDRLDKDTKRRQLFYVHNVGGKDEKAVLITEETDEKWQASLSSIFEPHPTDPNKLFFGSERDGFNHLYLATLEAETRAVASVPNTTAKVAEGSPGITSEVNIEPLTRGPWQVEWAKWVEGSDEIVFLSTREGYTEREFSSILLDNLSPVNIEGTNQKGMRGSAQLSEGSDAQLLYEFSQWDLPGELRAVRVCSRCRGLQFPRTITATTPEAFTKISWTEPKFLEIPSRDGKKIPAKIYLPPGHNPRSRTKYPMVIFVHGAGYLQNVINGWNNYYREFMFNDLLAKRGYVVLDIDYRGSAGYGRDWRTDVHDFLGGKDFDDHIDSIDHMVANYAVDQKRIGAYGGSYGGFMAGMLAMRAPERIAAAAALRPVFDWKNYFAANPFYTAQRLGFPDKNPEAYRRSSPISYADKLERPLLILHGMADSNVHVQDSVQLMEKLIRLGKTQYFEAMLYPSEDHGFVRPESWADEYERILAFFEKHLNDGKLLR
jgi:dipeptidyl aminopeptidase/acylaminoacyl peptidase